MNDNVNVNISSVSSMSSSSKFRALGDNRAIQHRVALAPANGASDSDKQSRISITHHCRQCHCHQAAAALPASGTAASAAVSATASGS